MKDQILKDKKILELVKRIVASKGNGVPAQESDYLDLVELVKRLQLGPEEMVSDLIADLIIKHSKNNPSKIALLNPLASHIDALNKTTKYVPKTRGVDTLVRYSGSEWSMKELTHKKEHPLHYMFSSGFGSVTLNAFDDYKSVHDALEKEDWANRVAFEILKANQPKQQCARPRIDHSAPLDLAFWTNGTEPQDGCVSNAIRPNLKAEFFEHVNYQGEVLELDPGYCFPNLVEKRRSGFLFWEIDDWNDTISSVKNGDGITVLCEHVFGAGATITLQGSVPYPIWKDTLSYMGNPCRYIESWANVRRRNLPRLDLAGWNDRVSSVYHYLF